MGRKLWCASMLAFFITAQGLVVTEAADIWSEPTKTEVWTENGNINQSTQPADTKKQQEAPKQKVNVNDFIGKWKLWIAGSMTSYYYTDSGNYAGSKYTPGASGGLLTIHKNGTYIFNKTKGKWRAAKPGEVYGVENALILLNGPDKMDWAVKRGKGKDEKIVLLWDSGGKYTDGSKIWIAGPEGTKTK
ncbi:hypothetical protein JQN58_13235 [Aneurinibacillus sp. BA2021]|nr:hypothetical protein [Aneurinibacillus sp. BA2021]